MDSRAPEVWGSALLQKLLKGLPVIAVFEQRLARALSMEKVATVARYMHS